MGACVSRAIDAYFRRYEQDTNPAVVRMISPDGTPTDHWYYRSDQAVATLGTYVGGVWIDTFEGPVSDLPTNVRGAFDEGLWEVAEEEMSIVWNMRKKGFTVFQSYIADVFNRATQLST